MANKDKTQVQKKIKTVLIVIGILTVILLLLNMIDFESIDISKLFGEEEEDYGDIYFYPADYDYNIFDNAVYSSIDSERLIYYTDYPDTTIITENINEYGALGEFLMDYFDTIINGDTEKYNSFLTENYIKENGKTAQFTMQMLYDLEVEKENEEFVKEGTLAGYTIYEFKFTYKIMFNNGTFRNDIGSDEARPQYFEVYFDGNEYKINSFIKVKNK